MFLLQVLEKYFPEVSRLSPSIGRQGKALRRQRLWKVVESQMGSTLEEQNMNSDDVVSVIYGVDKGSDEIPHDESRKFALFKDFTLSGLGRIGCGPVEDMSLLEIWKNVQPFSVGFIGTPFLITPSCYGINSEILNALTIFNYLFILNESENNVITCVRQASPQ